MKTTVLTILMFTVLTNVALWAQSAEEIDALSEFLPEEKLSYLQSDNDLLKEFAWINRHGYYISNMQGQKDISDLPDALEVEPMYLNSPLLNEEVIIQGNLNMLAYKFNLQREAPTHYRVGQSDYVLIIQSLTTSRKAYLNAK